MIAASRTRILIALLMVFIVLQFIRPARNESGQAEATDLNKVFAIPNNVYSLLKQSCYDCHSNHTVYPWYSHIQPMGWLIDRDIRNGKEKLNLSEFALYSSRRRTSKLQDMANRIKDGSMPLPAYQLMHSNARLTEGDKELLVGWIEQIKDSLASNK